MPNRLMVNVYLATPTKPRRKPLGVPALYGYPLGHGERRAEEKAGHEKHHEARGHTPVHGSEAQGFELRAVVDVVAESPGHHRGGHGLCGVEGAEEGRHRDRHVGPEPGDGIGDPRVPRPRLLRLHHGGQLPDDHGDVGYRHRQSHPDLRWDPHLDERERELRG